MGVEKYFYNTVIEEAKKSVKFNMYFHLISTSPRYLLEFAMILFVFILVIVMVMIENETNSLIPTITVFGFAGIRLIPESANIISNSLGRRFSIDSIERLNNDIQEIISERNIDKSICKDTKKINFNFLELENVSFKYEKNNHNTLNKISLEIKKGECIGIIGSSGSEINTLRKYNSWFIKTA